MIIETYSNVALGDACDIIARDPDAAKDWTPKIVTRGEPRILADGIIARIVHMPSGHVMPQMWRDGAWTLDEDLSAVAVFHSRRATASEIAAAGVPAW